MAIKLYKKSLSTLLLEGLLTEVNDNNGWQFESDAQEFFNSKHADGGEGDGGSGGYPDAYVATSAGKGGAECKMNLAASLGASIVSTSDIETIVYDHVSNAMLVTYKPTASAFTQSTINRILNANVSKFEGIYLDIKKMWIDGLKGIKHDTFVKTKPKNRTFDEVPTRIDIDVAPINGQPYPTTWQIKPAATKTITIDGLEQANPQHLVRDLFKLYCTSGFTGALKGGEVKAGGAPVKADLERIGADSDPRPVRRSRVYEPAGSRGTYQQDNRVKLTIDHKIRLALRKLNEASGDELDPDFSLDTNFEMEDEIFADLETGEFMYLDTDWHGQKQICTAADPNAKIPASNVINTIKSHNSAYLVVNPGTAQEFDPAKTMIGKLGTEDPAKLFPEDHPPISLSDFGIEMRFISGAVFYINIKYTGSTKAANMLSSGFKTISSCNWAQA
jgi:hypothetical protein